MSISKEELQRILRDPIDGKNITSQERLIAHAVISNISGRRGFDIRMLDDDIIEEIVDTLSNIIEETSSMDLDELKAELN